METTGSHNAWIKYFFPIVLKNHHYVFQEAEAIGITRFEPSLCNQWLHKIQSPKEKKKKKAEDKFQCEGPGFNPQYLRFLKKCTDIHRKEALEINLSENSPQRHKATFFFQALSYDSQNVKKTCCFRCCSHCLT